MPFHQFPAPPATQQYNNGVEAMFGFTEWLIGTGLFVETASSDGSGGPVESSADLANIWAYRILQATDDRGGLAIQHTAAGTGGTNHRSFYIQVCQPGDSFSTGGDATHIPEASNGQNLFGTGTPASPVGELLTQDINISPNAYTYFTASDEVDGEVHWQILFLRLGSIRQVLGRFPTQPMDPSDGEENAIYLHLLNSARFFRADGTWFTSLTTNNHIVFPPSGKHYLDPIFFAAGGILKGPSPYYLWWISNTSSTALFHVAGTGYYLSTSHFSFFLGPDEPNVPDVSLAVWPAHIVSSYVSPDKFPPTISDLSPEPPGPLSKHGAIGFRLTDNTGLFVLRELWIGFNDATTAYDLVHDGTQFLGAYSSESAATPTEGGWDFSIKRDLGWPYGGKVRLRALVVDAKGNTVVVDG